jgi:hypothetical protein
VPTIATDQVEVSRFDTLDGRRHQTQGDAAEAIKAEVLARFGADRPDCPGNDPGGDCRCAGRHPRW